MKFCAFDIEIVKPIPEGCRDWKELRPLGISCAATMCSGDEQPTLWFHGKYDEPLEGGMSREEVVELVDYLAGLHAMGYTITTWNGLGFDFDILAEESGMFDSCRDLALNHVDMMFHFLCIKGHPLGLDAAAKGIGLTGKIEGMHGDLAPDMWAKSVEDRRKVLEYVGQDARTTLEIAEQVQQTGVIGWTSKSSGRYNTCRIGSWLPVIEAVNLPLPDTSWMSNPMLRGTPLAWTGYGESKDDSDGFLRFGNLRGEKVRYTDGDGCCIWYPIETDGDETIGLCFDFPASDIDDMILLLQGLKKAKATEMNDKDAHS